MSVSPFCTLPTKAKGVKLVICSISPTPYDDRTTLKIDTECDIMMEFVLENLGIDIGIGDCLLLLRYHLALTVSILSLGTFPYSQQFTIGHKPKEEGTQGAHLLYIHGYGLNEQCTCIEKVMVWYIKFAMLPIIITHFR